MLWYHQSASMYLLSLKNRYSASIHLLSLKNRYSASICSISVVLKNQVKCPYMSVVLKLNKCHIYPNSNGNFFTAIANLT